MLKIVAPFLAVSDSPLTLVVNIVQVGWKVSTKTDAAKSWTGLIR